MVDLVGAVVAFFAADAGVAGIAGARVFGGELPPAETAHMPRSALVVGLSGGPSLTGASYVQADTQRVDVFAYGATPREAALLLGAAATAFRELRRTVSAGVLLHWAQPAGGFSDGRDPSFAWPRAWQSFQVLHSLTEV